MASGMGVNNQCIDIFTDLKIRHKHKFIIYKINGEKGEIEVEKCGNGCAAELKAQLPANDCRYAVFDGGKKMFFILWCPDVAPVKPRMTYASSKDALLNKLDGLQSNSIEAHDLSDLECIA